MPKRPDALIRAFGMSGHQITADLNGIGEKFGVALGHSQGVRKRRQLENYDQFDKEVRAEASLMSEYYEIFYCLEKTIRRLVVDLISEGDGEDWWNAGKVPVHIRNEVTVRQKVELDGGGSVRSDEEIDYTTFGELSDIIVSNWDLFAPVFSTKKAVQKVLGQLNLLRGPIAHCCPLSEDEVLRLELAVKDWFRMMS